MSSASSFTFLLLAKVDSMTQLLCTVLQSTWLFKCL